MLSVLPSIDQDVINLAPEFRALSIVVEAAPIANPDIGKDALSRACQSVTAGGAYGRKLT